jgi:hypothetical protein
MAKTTSAIMAVAQGLAADEGDESTWRDFTETADIALSSLLDWLRDQDEEELADELEELIDLGEDENED